MASSSCSATPHPEPVLEPGLAPVDISKVTLTQESDGVRLQGAPQTLDLQSTALNIIDLQASLQTQTIPMDDGAFNVLLEGSEITGTFRLQARAETLWSLPLDITAAALPDGYPVGLSTEALQSHIADCLTIPPLAQLFASDGFASVRGNLEISNDCDDSVHILELYWIAQPTAFSTISPPLPYTIDPHSMSTEIEIAFSPAPSLAPYDTLLVTFERNGEGPTVAAITVETIGMY